MSSAKKSRKSSSSRRHDVPVDEWKQYTSPDGHPYYYNAASKESRWELPVENESAPRGPAGGKRILALPKEKALDEAASVKQDDSLKKHQVSEDLEKRPQSIKAVVERNDLNSAPKVKNDRIKKLQASLEGRLQGPLMGMMKTPSILSTGQKEPIELTSEIKTESLEDQYEAETAGMSAAERLRFLRKKRQENMIIKRESLAGDDFMAEVANNLRKKGVIVKPIEKQRNGSGNGLDWEEREQAEVRRKRQQMEKEMQGKEQEDREQREQERLRQVELKQQRKQEKQRKQDSKVIKKKKKEDADRWIDRNDRMNGAESCAYSTADTSTVPVEDESHVSSPEHVVDRSSHESNVSSSPQVTAKSKLRPSGRDVHAVRDEHSADLEIVVLQEEKERARKERRARRKREKEMATVKLQTEVALEPSRRRSMSSPKLRTCSTGSNEVKENTRAKEQDLRAEERRMTKMEAAFTAQGLESDGVEQHEHSQQHVANSTGLATSFDHAGRYTTNGQPLSSQAVPGQAPFSGGVYPQYPCVMMPALPPSPYGYYHPLLPSPAMLMPMYSYGMIPPGYQPTAPTPPPSTDGTVALVPFGADYGGMFGQQIGPELSRCECCKGVGVGLVQKNGVCAHCNRLRLAFIIDSAQMRQRCSVCGGWGFQLLLANGMCVHCTRQVAGTAQTRLNIKAAGPGHPVTAPSAAAPQNLSVNPSRNDELDGIHWDDSSSDDSDWDE